MKGKILVLLAVCLVGLSGCDQLFALLGFNVKVSGTITTSGTLVTGNGSITVSDGKNSDQTYFSAHGTDANNSQTVQFEFPYVSKGTYSMVLTYTGIQGYSGTVTVNGQSVSFTETVNGASVTYSVDGVSIQDATTIDLYLGNLG